MGAPAKAYYEYERLDVLPLVPVEAVAVLDVGCAAGGFGAALKRRARCEVWGIELVAEVALLAAAHCDRVLTGDALELAPTLPDGYFDSIVFNDVLEHLPNPGELLRAMVPKLRPGGAMVASIPNIRYVRVLFELLVQADFRYRDAGVLDRTHLRFFTRKSIGRLFDEAGLDLLSTKGSGPSRLPFYWLFNLLTLGRFADTRYQQFLCQAVPRARRGQRPVRREAVP